MWDNDDNRYTERDIAEQDARETAEWQAAMQAAAEQLDAERDAFHAGQEAYEQVCLAEALAEMEPGVCTCGAVATWHNPAHFYCVCYI